MKIAIYLQLPKNAKNGQKSLKKASDYLTKNQAWVQACFNYRLTTDTYYLQVHLIPI